MRVVVESPFAGGFGNVKYGRECLRDSLNRGESPFASHLLYAQKGLLDDSVPTERKKGMAAAAAWLEVCDFVCVYMDLGITPGMVAGIIHATRFGKPVRLRWIRGQRKEEVIE
jgi:hypothetical protein